MIALFAYLIGAFVYESSDQINKKQEEIPTIGVLQYVSHPALDAIYQGILDELKEQGFEDGTSARIVYQNGQADQSKLSTMSQQLLSQHSDVLIGIATPSAQALANQTDTVPIILGAISDPKGAGLVASNDRPGGNITGVSDQSPVEAQMALIKELQPSIQTLGIMYSSAEDNSVYQVEKAKKAAESQGMVVTTYAVPSSNEMTQMTENVAKHNDAIYLPTDNTMANAMATIVDVANQAKTPIYPSVDTMVKEGGVATVGINQYQLGRQTGKMAAQVLTGELEPASTSIYTFETGDIVINQEQADKLGIIIPDTIKKEAIK